MLVFRLLCGSRDSSWLQVVIEIFKYSMKSIRRTHPDDFRTIVVPHPIFIFNPSAVKIFIQSFAHDRTTTISNERKKFFQNIYHNSKLLEYIFISFNIVRIHFVIRQIFSVLRTQWSKYDILKLNMVLWVLISNATLVVLVEPLNMGCYYFLEIHWTVLTIGTIGIFVILLLIL